MNTRKTRGKRIKYDEISSISSSNFNDPDDQEEVRKSRIRDSNKEYAKRMTILQTWSSFWEDYTTREGDAYEPLKAKEIIKKTKKITCPIESCGKAFTSYGGLKYHYARCNIERCYKCKVCEPHSELTTKGELLKHMILKHYPEGKLPDLDQEQKVIANSFLTGESKSERNSKTKTTSDSEPATNPNRLINAFFDLQDRVFKPSNTDERPFKDWRSDITDWESISHEFDRSKFYPPEYDSVHFRSKQNNQNWHTIKVGESTILKADSRGEPTSTVFFTGGINTAAAWMPKPPQYESKEEILAIAVDCVPMDYNRAYKLCHRGEACIQFWTMEADKDNTDKKLSLAYMVGHQNGTVFDMIWCPLGTSWEEQSDDHLLCKRVGLLALACGDGQIRILSVPHTKHLREKSSTRISKTYIESCPIYRVRPIATLVHPGVGASSDYQSTVCRTIAWSLEANQRFIAAGYTNGSIALFDLQNMSPIIYSNIGGCHILHPLRSYVAHGAPVTGIAISTSNRTGRSALDRVLIASGSTDKLLRIWNVVNDFCLTSERAPITKILWDYRFRGVITATDAAFTSYNNRVSYRYPVVEGHHNITISTHRSIVWGLANSLITNAIATSDGAGEIFVMPQTFNRSSHKRDRTLLSIHSLYTLLPHALELNPEAAQRSTVLRLATLTDLENLNNEEEDTPNNSNENEDKDEINDMETNADLSAIERPVANKPEKFLLPLEHRPIETYSRFKNKFGLEFVDYNQTTTRKSNSKIPESCARAGNLKNIYCDRNCDYPFSSINNVVWSPNVDTFSHLLSTTHIGLCRLDKVQAVEQTYKHFLDNIIINRKATITDTTTTTPEVEQEEDEEHE